MTDDPVAEIARATAARLAPELGQDVEAKVEAALYQRDSSRGVEQYDLVGIGILVVAIVTLAWMVYSDHRKRTPDASSAAVEGTLRNEIRREIEVTPDSIRITEVVVQEIMDRHTASLSSAASMDRILAVMGSTKITRLPEKGVSDRHELYRLLDDAMVAHIGITGDDGIPLVIPTAIARDGDSVLVHGSTGSGWMRRAADGRPACVTVTELAGIVVARSAFESSMRYRSAVVFGSFIRLADAEVERALDLLTDHLIPGRRAEVRRPARKELAATMVLRLPLTDWSLKVSAGWPEDTPADIDGDAWAGVVPLRRGYAAPLPAPDLRRGIPVPPSVRSLIAHDQMLRNLVRTGVMTERLSG